mgnify:CR=1 FL=1
MSYCRFENTAKDLADCVQAINMGQTDELNEYEIEGLKLLLNLCSEIVEEEDYIKEIIESYE